MLRFTEMLDSAKLQEMVPLLFGVLVDRIGPPPGQGLKVVELKGDTVQSNKNLNMPLTVQALNEDAEEIRLLLVMLINRLITLMPLIVKPFLADLGDILTVISLDPYHEVRKEAMRVIVLLCTTLAHQMRYYSEALVDCIKHNVKHRHSRVRVATIQALQVLVRRPSPARHGIPPTWRYPARLVRAVGNGRCAQGALRPHGLARSEPRGDLRLLPHGGEDAGDAHQLLRVPRERRVAARARGDGPCNGRVAPAAP